MELKEMIYRRKSTRSYTGEPVDEVTIQKVKNFAADIKPLYPDIKVRLEIVERAEVQCFLPWTTPQLIAVFSEDVEGDLENVGFMIQQLDLYIQSLGLGVCWLGMGKLDTQAVANKQKDGLKFVILLAFGHPKGIALRSDVSEFKRKSLSDISDKQDEKLEPARLAPSSVNSQPWYFLHEGDNIQVYCVRQGIFKIQKPSDINRIDIGIALAHMYITNADRFRFFKEDKVKEIKGYSYIGSFGL